MLNCLTLIFKIFYGSQYTHSFLIYAVSAKLLENLKLKNFLSSGMWRINSSEELFSTKKTTINVDLDFKFKERVSTALPLKNISMFFPAILNNSSEKAKIGFVCCLNPFSIALIFLRQVFLAQEFQDQSTHSCSISFRCSHLKHVIFIFKSN